MISIFDSVSEICHEIDLIYVSRPHSTTQMTEISSRIHFWGLEGPKWAKIDLKQRFSMKSGFSWRSAPVRILSICRRPGLGPGPRPFLFHFNRYIWSQGATYLPVTFAVWNILFWLFCFKVSNHQSSRYPPTYHLWPYPEKNNAKWSLASHMVRMQWTENLCERCAKK